MSTGAAFFGIYLLVGVILCIAALATAGKERRGPNFDVSDGTEMGAFVLLFIALLWPIWGLVLLVRSRGRAAKSKEQDE